MSQRLGRHPLDTANIRALRAFIAVVDAGGFSPAARQLHLAVSTVSKIVAGLEDSLGMALVYRNTRRVTVTEAGERFYHCCRSVMTEVNEATTPDDDQRAIRGHLRVVVSPSFGAAVLAPKLPLFLSRYPEISVDVLVSSAMPNLVQDRINVALVLRDRPEWKTASVRLATNARAFCAAPNYLARQGTPKTPAELAGHACLVSLLSGVHDTWMVRNGRKIKPIEISGSLASDDGNVLKNACLGGQGIANLYRFHVYKDLAAGRLVELLPEHQPNTNSIYAVFPHKRLKQRHAQVFIEFVREIIGDPPYWE